MRNVLNFLLSFIALCSSAVLAQGYPLTIIDDRDKPVTIAQPPQTVASVSSFGADVMAALGRQVAGISTLNGQRSAYLGDSATKAVSLGEVHQTNLEILTQLAPDLTIGLRTYTEPFARKIEETGTLLAFDLTTLDDSLNAVTLATRALGADSQGEAMNKGFLDELEAAAKQTDGNVSAVFLWHWGNVPYAYYNNHLTPQIMVRLGATNIHGEPPQGMASIDSAAMTMEALLRLNPDVILSFKGEAGPFVQHPAWQRLKAVQSGRAWRVADHYVMSHGPIARRMVLHEVAHLLYPSVFPEPSEIPLAARAKPMDFER
ncbi:MAG: ABC transporter substrate-binding protein [Gammaproteobacteria bacterium]|nr:ABC transporter substrate-binding protein [Gammaproteobacteria bacterium]